MDVIPEGAPSGPRAVNGRRLAGRHGVPGLRMSLDLARDGASVGLARRVVDAVLLAMGVDPTCRDELVLAISEGCANAVMHAAETDRYEVRVTFDDDCCIVDILDTGRRRTQLPIDAGLPDPTADNGRGLAIIANVTDSLRVTPRRPHGLKVRFTKRLT